MFVSYEFLNDAVQYWRVGILACIVRMIVSGKFGGTQGIIIRHGCLGGCACLSTYTSAIFRPVCQHKHMSMPQSLSLCLNSY